MRKIINSAFVSLDGVTEDPSSWATFDHDSGDEAAQALQTLDGMLITTPRSSVTTSSPR